MDVVPASIAGSWKICSHLTKAERNHLSILGLLISVWIPGTIFGIPILIRSFPSPGNWFVASVWAVLFIVSIPMLQRMMRHFLCSTTWANEHGFTPERLRLFSFSSKSLLKAFAVLSIGLVLIMAQNKAVKSYLGLQHSPQSNSPPARQNSALQFRRVLSNDETNVPAELLPNPFGQDQPPLRLEKGWLMDGESLQQARLSRNAGSKGWQIDFVSTPEGKARFAQITRTNIDRQLAVVFGGRVLSAPMIKSEIAGGAGAISGNFSLAEAVNIVEQLNRAHAVSSNAANAQEVTLVYDSEKVLGGQSSLLDLDTGRVLSWPKEVGDWNERRIDRWIEESGADLMSTAPLPGPRMIVSATTLVLLENEAWTHPPSRPALLQSLGRAASSEPMNTNAGSGMHEAIRVIQIITRHP